MMSDQEVLSTFMSDPTLNKRQKECECNGLFRKKKKVNMDSLYPAALKDVLGAKKYSSITVNLFSKIFNRVAPTPICNSALWSPASYYCHRHFDREQQIEQNLRSDQGIPDHHECFSG